MRDPALAGILSLLIPGVGQIYNGRVLIGIIWLIVTGVSWIGSAGTLGWVVHLISAWCAYSYAKVGADGAQEELGRPLENTLFFAGEATDVSGHNGTVHGAIASGQRAATTLASLT